MRHTQEAVLFNIQGQPQFCLLDEQGLRIRTLSPFPFISNGQFKEVDDFHFMLVTVRFELIGKGLDHRDMDPHKLKENLGYRVFGLDNKVNDVRTEDGRLRISIEHLLETGDFDNALEIAYKNRQITEESKILRSMVEI